MADKVESHIISLLFLVFRYNTERNILAKNWIIKNINSFRAYLFNTAAFSRLKCMIR